MKLHPNIKYIEDFDYLKRDFIVLVDDSKIFRTLKEYNHNSKGFIYDLKLIKETSNLAVGHSLD
ncbi:hypothetical protein CR513_16448, partial [Mucuna pruriens]